MADILDTRSTFICYSNTDLIRDGFIKPVIEREFIPPSSFNISLLNKKDRGTTYLISRDDSGKIIKAIEKRRTLPASKIKVELDFSKYQFDPTERPFNESTLSFMPGIGSGLYGPLLSYIGFGNISKAYTDKTFQILDSETLINIPIIVTKEILENEIIWMNGYPLSVFGIVKSHRNDDGFLVGLNFSSEQIKSIGKYEGYEFQGQGMQSKQIEGSTGQNGLFGIYGKPFVKFEDVKYEDQEQLFIEIIRDPRRLKFRADNFDENSDTNYPPTSSDSIDATESYIRIKTTGIKEGDILFITYNVCSNRYFRQNIRHMGKIAFGNAIGGLQWNRTIASEVDAWNYSIKKWVVPLLPKNINIKNIKEIKNVYKKNSDYKISLDDYLQNIDDINGNQRLNNSKYSNLEGWRLSAIVSNKVTMCFAADYRGIILWWDNSSGARNKYKVNIEENVNASWWDKLFGVSSIWTSGFGRSVVIFPANLIEDQDWFIEYLQSLPFVTPTGTGESGTYQQSDYEKIFEEYVDLRDKDTKSMLFDMTNITNSLRFDKEKIPYYRPFADALKKVSKYDKKDSGNGIGVALLDLFSNAISLFKDSSVQELSDFIVKYNQQRYYDNELGNKVDLSYIEFSDPLMCPNKIGDCQSKDFILDPTYYYSESFNAIQDAEPGAWMEFGTIQADVFGYKPPGQNVNSYWKVETPYFCGNFTRKTRIFAERKRELGSCPDYYSWIYANSSTTFTSEISYDINEKNGDSLLLFKDEQLHDALSYHIFRDGYFDDFNSRTKSDFNLTNVKPDFYTMILSPSGVLGYSRLIGSIPDYSNGILMMDSLFDKTYSTKLVNIDIIKNRNFKFNKSSQVNSYPSWQFKTGENMKIKNIKIIFDNRYDSFTRALKRNISPENYERLLAIYFDNTNVAICNNRLDFGEGILEYIMTIDCSYYFGTSLNFVCGLLGNEQINKLIKSIIISYFNSNNSSVEESNIFSYSIVNSSQMFTIHDNDGLIYSFFYDELSSNIGVMLSRDSGVTWERHNDLIRILAGEEVSLPFAIKDYETNKIHLFYVLQSSFLMYKMIDPNLLIYDDHLKRANKPTSYTAESYDKLNVEDPDRYYWGRYFSDEGTELRKNTSFFVVGSYMDTYFQEQIKITDDIINKNKEDITPPRFAFVGNELKMNTNFLGFAYTIFEDNPGELRIIYVDGSGKIGIKRNSIYSNVWESEIDGAIIHKTYVDEIKEKQYNNSFIKNIQIIRSSKDLSIFSFLYFNNGMLFLRNFQSSYFNVIINKDGTRYIPALELDKFSENRPIFIAGKIPDEIKNILIEESLNKIKFKDSQLYIYFPYDISTINKFNDDLSLDDDTRPFGCFLNNGLARIFYKDSLFNLDGIILDGLLKPKLELMDYITKEEVETA